MKKKVHTRITGSKRKQVKIEKSNFQKLMYSPASPSQIITALTIELLIIIRSIFI